MISLVIIAIAGIMLNSCKKSATEPFVPANDNSAQSTPSSQINSEVLQHAIAAYMQDQQEKGNLKSGAEFIPAFFTTDGFGFIKDADGYFDPDCGCFIITSGELAFFVTDLDENDFYRLNPDSTVSVHINSNNGIGMYANFGENTQAFGDGFNMTMDYRGGWVVETFEFGGVTYTFNFVDYFSGPSATVWHGAGKVQFDGTGPEHNLVGHLSASPGWKKVNLQLQLN